MKRTVAALTGAVILTGVLVLVFATRHGAAFEADTVTYLRLAANLHNFKRYALKTDTGEFQNNTHYPPLYPVVLSLFAGTGDGLKTAARALNIILLAINAALFSFLAWRLTGKTALSVFAAILFITMQSVRHVHAAALSEPLFICLLLSGLGAMLQYLISGRRRFLFPAAFFWGLSTLTRFSGAAILCAGALMILFLQRDRRGLKSVLIFFIGILPSLVGLCFLNPLSGASRSLSFYPPLWERVKPGLAVRLEWIIFFVGVAGFGIFLKKTQHRGFEIDATTRFLAVMSGFYLIFICISMMIIDAHIVLDSRMLLPVYLGGFLILLKWLGPILELPSKKSLVLYCLAGAVLLGGHFYQTAIWVKEGYARGHGYNRARWRQSKTMAFLKSGLFKGPIYSNAPDVIHIHTGLPAHFLPHLFSPNTQKKNAKFSRQLSDQLSRVSEHDGAVVFFNGLQWRPYIAGPDKVTHRPGVYLLRSFDDGALYRVHKPVDMKRR